MKLTTEELITAGVGWLFCPMDRVYEIFNFLTGDNLYTHQLPRAFKVCRPHLVEIFPWLSEIDENLETVSARQRLVQEYSKSHPGPHEIKPLDGTWLSMDPAQELSAMVDPAKIITVHVP